MNCKAILIAVGSLNLSEAYKQYILVVWYDPLNGLAFVGDQRDFSKERRTNNSPLTQYNHPYLPPEKANFLFFFFRLRCCITKISWGYHGDIIEIWKWRGFPTKLFNGLISVKLGLYSPLFSSDDVLKTSTAEGGNDNVKTAGNTACTRFLGLMESMFKKLAGRSDHRFPVRDPAPRVRRRRRMCLMRDYWSPGKWPWGALWRLSRNVLRVPQAQCLSSTPNYIPFCFWFNCLTVGRALWTKLGVKMGLHFGSLGVKVRGVISVRLSPYECSVFSKMSHGFQNLVRRFREEVLFVAPREHPKPHFQMTFSFFFRNLCWL